MTSRDAPTLLVPSSVLRALLKGEIVVDVRAGTEPPAAGTRFWLCPSGDDPELKPAYRMARDLSFPDEAVSGDTVRIDGWADLVAVGRAHLDAERIAALDSKTVLGLGPLAGSDVVVLALRAHRLAEPLTVPATLEGLGPDPGAMASEPALSNVAFEAKVAGVAEALPKGLAPAG